MCAPGAMSSVAKPMIWLYLRSASPFFTARVRILWPGGTGVAAATSPSTLVPARISMRATMTLSLGCRRIVSGAVMVSSRRQEGLGGALGADGINGGKQRAAFDFIQRAQRGAHTTPGHRVVASVADQRLAGGREGERHELLNDF